MEYETRTNGWLTFFEHWGFTLSILLAFGFFAALQFLFNLQGKPWVYLFVASIVLLGSGAALILRAKVPTYRSGQFFTSGVKSVPDNFADCYRWGWRLFLFGAVLSLCLFLSKQ